MFAFFGNEQIWTPPNPDDYIPHTAILECKCGQMYWSTKNIGHIGARTIFYFAGGCDWMRARFQDIGSCDCPGTDLTVDEKAMDHIINCPICQKYGY